MLSSGDGSYGEKVGCLLRCEHPLVSGFGYDIYVCIYIFDIFIDIFIY